MTTHQINAIVSLQRSERMLMQAIGRSHAIGHKKQVQYLNEQLTNTKRMISQLQSQ